MIYLDKWIILILGIVTVLYAVGSFIDEFFYLKTPLMVFIFSLIPRMIVLKLSFRIMPFYMRIHKIKKKKTERTYFIKKDYSTNTSKKKFVLFTCSYCIGFVLGILRIVGADNLDVLDINLINLGIIYLVSGLILLSIIFTTSVSGSVYLLRLAGVMYENKLNGTRINLGNELHQKMLLVIGPMQIIFVISTIMNDVNIIPFFLSLLFASLICFLASLFSFYVIKQIDEDKLLKKINNKLQDYLE